MGIYKKIRETWQSESPELKALWKERLVAWRREPSTNRIERPTRLDRARAVGYKAKPGFVIVRQRVARGGHARPSYLGGRRSKNQTKRLNLHVNYQRIAEQRANDAHVNCEVIGSYFVLKDGHYAWYEVILADRMHPAILNDKRFAWLSLPANRARAYRGLTSSGRRSRGLMNKGKGAEKAR